ncbi:MAG: cupin domain-containing protein [Ignavibacteria bacterium]|nr:MAG: cupin domain-containing protein [Ignavibacteria bacterium]
MSELEKLIEKLQLIPHPEGGYYKETFRSNDTVKIERENTNHSRNTLTSIYYLLSGKDKSHFHKIKSDEIWYHHSGCDVLIHIITNDGELKTEKLGPNGNHQVVVTKEQWFAAELVNKNEFALVGCAVAPGFDFSDFTLGSRNELIKSFPQHKEVIEKFTRSE